MKYLITVLTLLLCFQINLFGQTIEFEKSYLEHTNTEFFAVDELPSGDFILAGQSNFEGLFLNQRYLTRINSDGDTLWTRTIITPLGGNAKAVEALSDGTFVTAGFNRIPGAQNTIGYFSKFDADGSLMWEQTYGEINYRFDNVIKTTDGGFMLTGFHTISATDIAYNIIKTDANGNEIWSYLIEDADNFNPFPVDVLENQDGELILAGKFKAAPISGGFMIKLSASGDLLLEKYYNDQNRIERIIQTNTNDYLLCGQSSTDRSFLMKVDQNGEKLWEKTYGDPQFFSTNHDVVESPYGDIYLCGMSADLNIFEAILIKTDDTGELIWQSAYGGAESDRFHKIILTSDLKLLMAGFTNELQNTVVSSGYVVKIDDKISALSIDEKYISNKLLVQPNPSDGTVHVNFTADIGQVKQVEIYNIDGKLCTANHQIHTDRIEIDGLPQGLYFVKIYNNQQAFRSELFVVK